MGLSGRKTKQRIPADPRNLTWADGLLIIGNHIFNFSLNEPQFKMLRNSGPAISQNSDGILRKALELLAMVERLI